AIITLLTLSLVGAAALIVGLGDRGEISWNGFRQITKGNLPACSTALPLTAAPVAASDYSYLIPLGNFNPPDHSTPTDHMYYVFKQVGSGGSFQSLKANVYSPGTLKLAELSRNTAIISGQTFTD